MSKAVQELIGFSQLYYVICLKHYRHFINQSDENQPKLMQGSKLTLENPQNASDIDNIL